MTIKARYTELQKQIAAIVLLPSISILLFIFGMLQIKEYGFSETVMDILIYGGTVVILGGCILAILRGVIVSVVMDYDEKGIFIRKTSASFLYKREQYIDYMDMRQFSIENDPNGKVFMSLKFKTSKASILMFPGDNDNADDFFSAGEAINAIILKRNAILPTQDNIMQRSFYDGKGMKILAGTLVFVILLLTALKIYDAESFPTWRLIAMCIIAIPFLIRVFSEKHNNDF